MLISQTTIQAVKDRADIIDIVSQFVKLKKQGSNFSGLCPFHDEKSGSFTVSPARQIYKCFGCGKSGDAIQFIIEHENKPYHEAIQWLAGHYNITVEYQQENEDQKKQRQQAQDQRQLLQQVLQQSSAKYQAALAAAPQAMQYLQQRHISNECIQFWGLGYAPGERQFLSHHFINNNLYQPAVDLGIIKTKEGKTFDFYRNRIIIPIHDHQGNLTGFAGRWLPTGNPAEDDAQAKYFNPSESLLYKKSETLFGLYQALQAKAFRKSGAEAPPAYITEGYFDVISMHEAGVPNTVATCNSFITLQHIKLLKRYTNHFVFMVEDLPSQEAVLKSVDLCLQHGVNTEVIQLYKKISDNGKEKIIKQDADDYARQYRQQAILHHQAADQ